MLRSAAIPANFQANGKVQGDHFEDTCVFVLRQAGFAVEDTDLRVAFPDAGVEVDIIATNTIAAISFYITCKGSYQGPEPGCKRTDTLKKAMAEAYALHVNGWGPVLLLTSHLPIANRSLTLLRSTAPEILFDAIEPTSHAGFRRLKWLAAATETELRHDLTARQSQFDARLRPERNPLA